MGSCQPDQSLGGTHRADALRPYSQAQGKHSERAHTHTHTHTYTHIPISGVNHSVCFTGVEMTSRVCATPDRVTLGARDIVHIRVRHIWVRGQTKSAKFQA